MFPSRPKKDLPSDLKGVEMSSSRNSKKDLPCDEALEEVNKHLCEAFAILKCETNKVRKEKEAFEEVAKKLEHVHFSKMLKLNVGGHLFSTGLETMNKDPGTFFINQHIQYKNRGLKSS